VYLLKESKTSLGMLCLDDLDEMNFYTKNVDYNMNSFVVQLELHFGIDIASVFMYLQQLLALLPLQW
jgi:hypothetical protein